MGYLMAPGMRVNLLQGDAVSQRTTLRFDASIVAGRVNTETTLPIKIKLLRSLNLSLQLWSKLTNGGKGSSDGHSKG